MKTLYVCTIIGSSGRECVLIVSFQFHGSKAGHFESNLFWVGQYDHHLPIGRKTNPILV